MKIQTYKPSWWKDYIKILDWSFIVLVLLGILWIFYLGLYDDKFDWKGAVIGLIPTIPAGLIWFMKKKENWVNNLPTYLNVTLKDPEREIARFEMIPIQNGIDIRQQAQTVLQAINGNRINSLETFIRPQKLKEGAIKHDPEGEIECGKPFELKAITLYTTKNISKTSPEEKSTAPTEKDHTKTDEDNSIHLPENKLWYWCPTDEDSVLGKKPTLINHQSFITHTDSSTAPQDTKTPSDQKEPS